VLQRQKRVARIQAKIDALRNVKGALNSKQVAKLFNVLRGQVCRLVKENGMPSYHSGVNVWFCPEALIHWLQEKKETECKHARFN
jgi:hypothetical protein